MQGLRPSQHDGHTRHLPDIAETAQPFLLEEVGLINQQGTRIPPQFLADLVFEFRDAGLVIKL
jgi:hypothetical protein